jgi:hypothetical protein
MSELPTPALPGEPVNVSPEPRRLRDIAREIRQNWKRVNFAAEPYLDALTTLNTVNDNYFEDTGRSVVAYFLANAGGWRGEVAKRIKAELREMTK